MNKDTFHKKADKMGDFYCYYNKPGSNVTQFLVGTIDLDNDYIKSQLRGRVNTKEGEVAIWNWRFNSLTKLPYTAIKKLTPLQSVLKNHG